MTIKLMITCDDCGLAPGIDQSASALFMQGMVSSASIMTNFQQSKQAFDLFADHPNFEMGVHLNLTDGEPLTRSARQSDLVGSNGCFRHRIVLFGLSLLATNSFLAVMEEELRAQIETFFQAGLRPAHLTTHIHFHVFPAVKALVYRLAEEYEVQWVRNTDFRVAVFPMNPILNTTPNHNHNLHPFNIPDYVVMTRAYLDYPPEQMLKDILKLQGTVELILHPSIAEDPAYPASVAYTPRQRHRETRYLQAFFELLQPHIGVDVTLVNTTGVLSPSE